MSDDDPVQLLKDLLERVDAGFQVSERRLSELGTRVTELTRQTDAAHGGVKMTLGALEGLQTTVDTLANGVLQLSAQISQLREGVADQVRLEVEKHFDGSQSIADLAERPP